MKKIKIALACVSLLAGLNSAYAKDNSIDSEVAAKNAVHPISRFSVPKFSALPKDIQKRFLGVQKKLGFVPNVLLGLAHRPDELRVFLNYADVIMNRKSGLSKADKQMIIIPFSGYNGCQYCVQSHGANLRLITKKTTLSDQLAINYREADITPKQKAMIDFAMKVTKNSKAINENDFKKLEKYGLTKEDAWDIASITSFFNMSNRMMNFTKIRPDEQYYTMGRNIKK